ncbi:MAG: energy transducer TonB [Gemmatimonadota bacterium]
MSLRSAMIVATAVLTLPAHRAVGQSRWVDSTVERLNWGNVNGLIIPDTATGMQLWIETSKVFYQGGSHRFDAHFVPGENIDRWLAQAQAVLGSTAPRDSSVSQIQTRELISTDSSRLSLIRERKGRGWGSRIHLLLVPGPETDSAAWSLSLKPDEARHFVEAFFHGISRSSVVAQEFPLRDLIMLESGVTQPPRMLSRGNLHYPAELRGRKEGEVWTSFVIDQEGIVEPNSIRVYLSDDPGFAREVRRTLGQMKYAPGMVNSEPVRVLVSQHFIFQGH